jgi:hypothetical protein
MIAIARSYIKKKLIKTRKRKRKTNKNFDEMHKNSR